MPPLMRLRLHAWHAPRSTDVAPLALCRALRTEQIRIVSLQPPLDQILLLARTPGGPSAWVLHQPRGGFQRRWSANLLVGRAAFLRRPPPPRPGAPRGPGGPAAAPARLRSPPEGRGIPAVLAKILFPTLASPGDLPDPFVSIYPILALRHFDARLREHAAYGLRLQCDAQGRTRLVLWSDARFFTNPSADKIRNAKVAPTIADALETAACCRDGRATLDRDGALHLATLDAGGPQAARLPGRVSRVDVRLPNRGLGFGEACPRPPDGRALLLLPGQNAPALSGHRVLAFV